MIRFALRRILIIAGSLFVVSIIVFTLLSVLPGSPAQVILGTQGTPQAVAALSRRLGLNHSLLAQYGHWVHALVTGRFGISYVSQQPIGHQIGQALQVTGPLIIFSMVVGLVVAFFLGISGALAHDRKLGSAFGAISQIGIAIPTFVGGILLIIIFAVKTELLPASGFPGWSTPVQAIRSLILPSITLGLVEGAVLSRYIRAAVLEVLDSEYLRTARAKGLTRGQALRRHGLRPAMIPVVTVIGLEIAGLIIGAIVVENVFTLPGVGSLLLASVDNRDLLVVQDIVMLAAAAVLVINMAVDLSYRLLDPRVRKPA